jgi:8-oxo-dGTP diphosphatase
MKAAAGVLFTDRNDRVLLVQPSYKQHWDIPGGIVETGETPRQAAAREVKEELGITCTVGRLIVVDAVTLSSGELLTAFVFRGSRIDTGSIRLDGKEILAWAWCDLAAHVELTRTAPIFQARIIAAMRASIAGRTEYTESGSVAP